MKSRIVIGAGALFLAGIAGMASGCEDAGKKPIRAQVPATKQGPTTTSATAAAPAQTKTVLPALPLHAAGIRPAPVLSYPQRDAKSELIAQVEQKFASGQQNYKAGHLEAARKDFDDAVDALLESGYDLDNDPKLGERSIESSTRFTPTTAGVPAGDLVFREVIMVPAPIDEVAEMTFPVDPRLMSARGGIGGNISHDCR